MRLLRPASEPEMVATFLQQELESARFGTTLWEILERERVSLPTAFRRR